MTIDTQSVNIEKSFISQTLTKISENGEKYNYSSIKKTTRIISLQRRQYTIHTV